MPIQIDISRLDRLVLIVARGSLSSDEIRRKTHELVDAKVTPYGKIVDVSGVSSEVTKGQVNRIAAMLRKASPTQGKVAFVINPDINPERKGFGHAFAEAVKCDKLIRIFRSIHDARDWVRPLA